MDYNHLEIEKKWQKKWAENKTYKAHDNFEKPKFYVLDMFPYPSGAGLHVGHPLGYIASDIYARYKRHQGYNVLHPMGYDSFGLPAEQYAIQTGQHPAVTTKTNIEGGIDKAGNKIPGYRKQLDILGFSFDWDREIRTSNPNYYKWTQWIFKQLYNSWYNETNNKAEDITNLISIFEKEGNVNLKATTSEETIFTAANWHKFTELEQQSILMNYRLTYLSDSWVNWCPALGTVLANDEIKEGLSERGGYPVERKLMKQWSMRITAYANRLIQDLDTVDWSESIKEQQKNWIGKSRGASIKFSPYPSEEDLKWEIEVFTTRPDTIFGVNFIVLAPEHELVSRITTAEYKKEVTNYQAQAKAKSERDRQANVKEISGQFTGAYAIHPFTGKKVQIWIGDYVLATYGTGAVMAVPAGDQRDWSFANHFGIEILPIFEKIDSTKGAYQEKEAKLINSDFLNGLTAKNAINEAIKAIQEKGIGKGKIQYRLRDAVFSRQRYWGEPFPVYYKNEIPYLIEDDKLPVKLPEIDTYLPTEKGEPPLARAEKKAWNVLKGDRMECNTMPGWAGSSWYYLRYMDPHNQTEFVSKQKADYWGQVDLYIGGAEHATGHLLYSRFWCKFLFDKGYISFHEPFKKMINQGMILGRSSFVYRIKDSNKFISFNKKKETETISLHTDIHFVDNDILDQKAFKNWREEYKNAEFITEENGDYICGWEIEKMSKSKYNIQTPDELVEKFGADTLRCYEMFLGPLEQAKPWDTKGINGVSNFLRKVWRLFHQEEVFTVTEGEPDKKALKTLHTLIKKATEDLERFSFNTIVSALMIAVNELTDQKCNNKQIGSELLVILSPYAPHIAEELWCKLGNKTSITTQSWPTFNLKFLEEDAFEYPVSFNGKMRFKIELPTNLSKEEIEKEVLSAEQATKYLEGKTPKKIIVVPKRIVNIVV